MFYDLKFWFFMCIFVNFLQAEFILLNIKHGTIVGKTGYTIRKNMPWSLFLGIPYAEPPVRFEMPVAKGPWYDPIVCTYDKPECVQGGLTGPVTGQEDCLTLSVYTPNITGNYPVFVWIHGGYLTAGNSSYKNQAPDLLVEEGIVFVEIQYRLGIFGFLSTRDSVCPGNLGFHDQVLALKWVQENIKYFGGDPNRVTLGGQSAGAVSTSLHLLSPKSKGLFHAMILNSGTCLCSWSYNRRAIRPSHLLVEEWKEMNYVDLQIESFVDSSLVAIENPLYGIWYGYVSEHDHPNAFFTGNAEYRLATGDFTKVPIMLGFTSREALFFGNITQNIRTYLFNYDLFSTNLVPVELKRSNLTCTMDITDDIKTHYFKNKLISSQTDPVYDFVSADQFNRPLVQTAYDISQFLPMDTYFYQFSHEGNLSGVEFRQTWGVGHEEDLSYLFYKNRTASETDNLKRNQVVRLWTNFVKHHNPTPSEDPLLQNIIWKPFLNANSNETNYLNINTTLELSKNPKNDDIQFYKGIYKKCGQGNYTTY